jgi:transglutaminase-like putative cysteine protease
MRSNPQEVSGSRVRLHYGVELKFKVIAPAEFLLNVHAARTSRQIVVDERFSLAPHREFVLDCDPLTGNRIVGFNAASGAIVAIYEALVEIEHRIDLPACVKPAAPASLPVSTLRFMFPSRYCQADLVAKHAWDTFGRFPRGYAQVRAVCDWVRENIRFQVGVSNSATSAVDTLRDRVGVCRDFAHTMIACCRALNYPARFVTGVDYGSDPALGPPDFHAYVEVFMGGAWYVFDPTGISPVTGLMRIGTGRDAAEVSFATLFGPVETTMPRVRYGLIEDPVRGYTAPIRTELAVSTAG